MTVIPVGIEISFGSNTGLLSELKEILIGGKVVPARL
jgi:hypothetical protein